MCGPFLLGLHAGGWGQGRERDVEGWPAERSRDGGRPDGARESGMLQFFLSQLGKLLLILFHVLGGDDAEPGGEPSSPQIADNCLSLSLPAG